MKTKFHDLGVTGCSDGACIFQDNSKGMHTNGGCGCCRNQHKVLRALNTQDQQIESLRATISRLEADKSSWIEAFGLVSTLHGTMPINVNDPVGMAQQIEAHVTGTISRLREYARHNTRCERHRWQGDLRRECDCGYDELIAALAGGAE